MKFKLDENFGNRTRQLFRAQGHNVKTVREQGLQGTSDQHLYEVCCNEKLCLVTLDLDFADVTHFSPYQADGIVIIRVPRNPSLVLLERLVLQFLEALTKISVEKRLWIVEIGRIRIHELEMDAE